MFSTLIVATDLEAGPDRAIRVASTLAKRGRVPLEVLSVVPRSGDPRHLEQQQQKLARSIGCSMTVVEDDDVATAIVDHVRNRQGTLLLMSTGATGLVSEVRHSVTGNVLARLTQPVLLLGPHVPDAVPLAAPTLVAGIDRTFEPSPALPLIESWYRTFRGHRPWVVDVVATPGWPPGTIEEADERRHVDEVAETLAVRGIDAAAKIIHGWDAVSSLLAFADRVEDPVFVMTSDRWARGPSHWYLTTRRLVQQSPHPVLVVPSDVSC